MYACLGSSPLARGLLRTGGVQQHAPRIIPARAGFTQHRRVHRRGPADHPRSRGVYVPIQLCSYPIVGSSPLARGLPGPGRPAPRAARIIPARAGFTHCPAGRYRCRRDHPRSRGVYPQRATSTSNSRGSSPLARGLPQGAAADDAAPGIIPARAGFTWECRSTPARTADHPRSRGVYILRMNGR